MKETQVVTIGRPRRELAVDDPLGVHRQGGQSATSMVPVSNGTNKARSGGPSAE